MVGRIKNIHLPGNANFVSFKAEHEFLNAPLQKYSVVELLLKQKEPTEILNWNIWTDNYFDFINWDVSHSYGLLLGKPFSLRLVF